MTFHFAQVAFALLAGGATIIIVAGLVIEAVHGDRQSVRPQGAEDMVASRPPLGELHSSDSEVQEDRAKAKHASIAHGSRRQRGKKRGVGEENGEAARKGRKRRAKQDERRSRRQARESQPAEGTDR